MSVYYNEFDPFAAEWLTALMGGGHIPAGALDRRSIADVQPEDCGRISHFFAGIAGWPLALELAGWPADREVWTGSCPCQPFSTAGKRRGTADERHLWPEFRRLIAKRRPATIFGEQVASRAGREWLAGVRADLEALGYAVGAVDLCAAGVGSPHIRQRLFYGAVRRDRDSGVADADKRLGGQGCAVGNGRDHRGDAEQGTGLGCGSGAERLGNALGEGLEERPSERRDHEPQCAAAGRMGDAASEQMGRAGQPWQDSVWLRCLDGKARRIEPGTFPLADGVSARVGRLRGYGNAIVPQVAAQFVRAFLECR